MPLPDIIREVAGTADAYCTSVDRAALNNENSLMLTMTWTLKLFPRLSPGGLGRVFGGLRLALVAAFVYALLLNGGSIVFAALAMLICTDVLQDLRHFQYTVYPFLAPMLLGLAGLCAILFRHSPASAKVVLPLSASLGVFTAFCANMRSSHLPLYVLFFLINAGVLTRREPRRVLLPFSLATVACFAVGYASFSWLLIRPLIPDGPHTNRTHHVVAHPLVLGLALPPSDLSRREGIQWNDEAGLALARRMIPEATYLGPDYERALFRYYWSLWRQYPGEMIAIYWSKLAASGKGMFAEPGGETEHQSTARVLALPGVRINGIWLTLLYLAALSAYALSWRRKGSRLALMFATLSMAAIGLLLEAAAVIPEFRLMYHAYLLIYTALLALWAAQNAVDAMSGWAQTRRFTDPHPAANH
jgi:hypothetical protein